MKTLACILAFSVVLQAEAADFSTEALALPQGAFHKPKIIQLISSTLKSKVVKIGFMSALLPSLAQAHDYFLDNAGNLMVHFDAWNKASAAQNTIGGVGVDILKATGEHVTWPGISKAITHLATRTPMAGGNYSITGLPSEAIAKLVKTISKVTPHADSIGKIIDPKEASSHFFDYITKPWMEINGHYRGGFYETLHQAKEDPFSPALGGWHYIGPPDIHAYLSHFQMHEMSFSSYILPHLIPYIVAGMLIAGIIISWKYFHKHQKIMSNAALVTIPLLLAMKAFGAPCDEAGCSSPLWSYIKKPFMTAGGQYSNHTWVSLHEAKTDPFSPAFTYELLKPNPPPFQLHNVEGLWKIPVQIYHTWSSMPLGSQLFLFVMAAIIITGMATFFAPKRRLERMFLKNIGTGSFSDRQIFIDKYGSLKLINTIKSFGPSKKIILRYAFPEILDLIKNRENAINRKVWMNGTMQTRSKLIKPHHGNVWYPPEGYYESQESGYNGEFQRGVFVETKPGYSVWEWIDPHKEKRIALDKAISRFHRVTNRSS